MESDNASGQLTSETDQAPQPDLLLYADRPERAKEIAKIKRLNRLERFWTILAISGQLLGTFLLLRYVPEPLKTLLIFVWAISVVSYIQYAGSMSQIVGLVRDHLWQNSIDRTTVVIREGLDELRADRANRLGKKDESIERVVARVNEVYEQERRIVSQQSKGKDTGRPETTREEWIKRGLTILEVEEYHDRQQVSYEQACARAGVAYSTFRDWRRKIPKDCLSEARARLTRN